MARGEGHAKDFLTVGSMGHANSIALGIALAKPNRQVRLRGNIIINNVFIYLYIGWNRLGGTCMIEGRRFKCRLTSCNVLQVYCLDGDGALMMHMGGMATIAQCKPVCALVCGLSSFFSFSTCKPVGVFVLFFFFLFIIFKRAKKTNG